MIWLPFQSVSPSRRYRISHYEKFILICVILLIVFENIEVEFSTDLTQQSYTIRHKV